MRRAGPFDSPDFVAVGHVTIDVTPTAEHPAGERRYGGAAAFAALTAVSLGLKAAVVTSAAAAYPFQQVMPGVAVCNVESTHTTTFQNVYMPAGRRQLLAGRAANITASSVPHDWRSPAIALICPLAREVPGDAISWFPHSLTGAVLQGFFREWDQYGVVSTRPSPPMTENVRCALAIASDRELTPAAAAQWAGAAELVACTSGPAGAALLHHGNWAQVPAPRVEENDPTGAGDVWAAAYMVRRAETADVLDAARFASATASLSVTGAGLAGIPSRRDVERSLSGAW